MGNIDDKELFPLFNNGGTYVRCDYYLAEAENSYLLGMRNNSFAIFLPLLIEQLFEISLPQRHQYNKLEGLICMDQYNGHIIKLNNKST